MATSPTTSLEATRRISLGVKLPVLAGLGLLLLVSMVVAAGIGPLAISPMEALGILAERIGIWQSTASEQASLVLNSIRLPRVVLAVIVGASLAVAGAAMQGLFRNPLADPGLIGVSAGAALAVGCVIVLAGPITSYLGLYSLSFAAFIGGLVTCLIVFRFAQFGGATSVTYMLLAGIAVNALAGAGTGFLTFLSDDQQLRSLTFWTMGSLGGARWSMVLVVTTLIIPTLAYMVVKAREINLLMLGEHEAQHLGVDVERLKRRMVIAAALIVGAAVSVSGIIGFIGLVVPHLLRLSIGPDHRTLIPASALLGGIVLVIGDTLARTVVAPAELPIGILTSLIGGPFFLWLLMRHQTRSLGL